MCVVLSDSDFLHLAVSCLCLVHVGRQALGLSALLSLKWWSFLSVQPRGPLGPNAGHSDKPVMELGLQTFPSKWLHSRAELGHGCVLM